MGARKPSIERVEVKTDEQKQALTNLLQAIQGLPQDFFSNLGGANIQEQPIFNEAISALSQQIANTNDPTRIKENFEMNIAQPQREAFRDQILPALQERLGRSGAFRNLSLKGALDLEKNLAGQLSQELLNRESAGLNAISQSLGFAQAPQSSTLNNIQALLNALQLGSQDMFAIQQKQGKAGIGGAVGTGIGAGLGALIGGPSGAKIGGTVGGGIGSQF